MRGCAQLIPLLFCLLHARAACSAGQPPIPIGLDAYRQWEQLPLLRTGLRAYMRSTYDRTGGNHAADASHFLYQLADDRNVTLDVEGAGILYFVRTNHWHGSPWYYEVDGAEHLVQESSTATPSNPVENSVFIPEDLFPNPLTWTWSITKGADLMWVPIPFERSFRLAYGRTRYGTGYYIYHQVVPGTPLSQPIIAWDGATPPGQDVLDLLNRSGSDIAPIPGTPDGDLAGVVEHTGTFTLEPAAMTTFLDLQTSGALVRALEFSVPRADAIPFSRARLRVTWDNSAFPSIDAPVALFFGAGTLYNRDDKEFLVKAFPMNVRFDEERVHLACYFPMPFFKSARFEIIGIPDHSIDNIEWSVRTTPLTAPQHHLATFHASYRDHPNPTPGRDLVLLDTRTTEGGGNWSGHFVGTSIIFSHEAVLWTLEGDPRFFFDDSQTPQAYGTGTEEWCGGGDYWGGRTMTLPLAGHPVGAPAPQLALNEDDKIESAYRFLIADLMPFGKNAVIRLEHGGNNESQEHYETVTYWYGVPRSTLELTDYLDVGSVQSEQAHSYESPDASTPEIVSSRYEWGVDTLNGQTIYAPHEETVRTSAHGSEFTLRIDPENVGVMLRRTLDYQKPNQRARVSIQTESGWEEAGYWYTAGSNTCVYSNPVGELGATEHVVVASNRRFRDDEFLVPRHLTEGRLSIRVRMEFTPVERPLFPGHPLPALLWSEIRYKAYCFKLLPEPAPAPTNTWIAE